MHPLMQRLSTPSAQRRARARRARRRRRPRAAGAHAPRRAAAPARPGRRRLRLAAGAAAAAAPVPGAEGAATGPLAPNAFVRVGTDNLVTVVCKHHEMGQGNTTGLASLVADELDADWSLVRTEYAPSDAKLLRQPRVRPCRAPAARRRSPTRTCSTAPPAPTARAMLVAAAAEAWKVPAGEIRTAKSVLTPRVGQARHLRRDGRGREPKQAPPANPALKTPAQFTLIGKDHATPRVDSPSKCNGTRDLHRSTSSCPAC